MPEERQEPQTKMAQRRRQLRLSQKEVAELTGIPVRTLRRLEAGEVENPGIRHLANLARVLGVELNEVIEDEWLEWTVFDARAAEPPPDEHWVPRR